MAIQTINMEKWLIFINGDFINYNKNENGQFTSYNDDVWTKEEFNSEQDWINRLTELGINIEEE
jgi:hypothetical protein